MSKVITSSNFESDVLKAEKTVVLDFFATWCGPCKMLAPVLEALETAHPEIIVGKVDIDEDIELAKEFRIASVPTVLVFKNGEVTNKVIGAQSLQALEALL